VLIYKDYKKDKIVSFPITTLIALVAYFISRAALTSSKQVYIGLFLALILVTSLMISSKGLSILALHVSVTSFSIVILMVTFFETTLLERHITKIKKGEIGSNTKSVEREYNEIFILIGCGLLGIVLSLVSGLMVLGELDIELIFKIVFTSFALIIYMLTFLGVKYAHLKVRYAVRGTIISFAMVLLAYFGNTIILINYL
jgi:ABC-type uncharacterized transport system permease subunit|tara:strand:- start:440 stop:1039 length:600 start_codon:yes stop_codon:yes gene_type:complete